MSKSGLLTREALPNQRALLTRRGPLTRRALLTCLIALAPCPFAHAEVKLIVGPTPIVHGDARAAGDITVVNERLAFALAVESAVPYGVPRGALIDLAPVVNGQIGRDRIVFADFIPNNWSAWPNARRQVDIVERGPNRAVICITRDWGNVTIATVYALSSNSDHIEIETTMSNGGAALPNLLSGLTLWPNSGFFFGVPGMQGVPEGKVAASAHRVVAYDEDWAIALHADYFDHVGDESKDLYELNTLAAGQSRTFKGWLQVNSSGDLAPIVRAEIARNHLAAGTIHGNVRDQHENAVEQPVVVVEMRGKPYAWTRGNAGHYEITLPQGEYTLYATAKNYTQSRKVEVKVSAASDQTRDFRDLEAAGRIQFAVTESHHGEPLDARITIAEGQQPVVEFLGRRTFFTELDRKGRVDLPIAPGKYEFIVSSGGGFLAPSQRVKVEVAPHAVTTSNAVLTKLFDPVSQGWYAADLHHHADQAEAVTPPADLARSQLAAGLDLLFVSDHDSTVNHRILQKIADQRGVGFIPGMELSPSWGHFNAYPLTLGLNLQVDTATATVDDVLKEARRLGAIVVQINHPFIPYGYLTSVAAGVAPGGFNPTFDLLEINQAAPEDDDKVLHALWNFWNARHHYYLSAGTDAHDVWNSRSGQVRVFAHVTGKVSAESFAESLKAGHAYVTHGPLIFPDIIFGEERRVKPGEPFSLGFGLKAVDGLKSVELIGEGTVLEHRSFAGAPREARADFPLRTQQATWYALVVEDARGRRAYTNPIWIDAVGY